MRINKSTKNERHRAKKILLKCEFVANMTQQYYIYVQDEIFFEKYYLGALAWCNLFYSFSFLLRDVILTSARFESYL